jgi:cysteinyl-tRNA synthetase
VYFDVRSWPEYGSLTGQSLDDMANADDADPRGKRDPRDFALWKGRKADEPESASWPTPFGAGRPGWHLECSAMARRWLGDEFDIHGGGIDLRFPHHENEQAQSRAAGFGFASYWLHNAWITTAGEKMSKSLGNSLVVPAVLERVRGIELRFYVVAAHYRSHVEFSFDALEESAAGFARIENFLTRAARVLGTVELPAAEPGTDAPGLAFPLPDAFVEAMDDDLGTPGAVAVLYDAVREGNKLLGDSGDHGDHGSRDLGALTAVATSVRGMLAVLGLDPFDPHWSGGAASGDEPRLTAAVDALVATLLEQRQSARDSKDFALADAIRDQLKTAGIELEDTPQGPRWSL